MFLTSMTIMICSVFTPCNPFFAMDTGTKDATHQTPAEQAALVKELGFDGVAPVYTTLPELKAWIEAADAASIPINAAYLGMCVDDRETAMTPELRDVVAALKGRDTLVWLYLTSKKYAPSSLDGDADALVAVGALADAAKEAGIRIALYPHTGFWVERVEDAVRVANACDRPTVGVTFNLCHWLMVDGKELEVRIRLAMPRLFMVTINGADVGGKDWGHLIQPLDTGTYDAGAFIRMLHELGYNGPIGLQHYGIGGDARVNLQRSMEAWKQINDGVKKDDPK